MNNLLIQLKKRELVLREEYFDITELSEYDAIEIELNRTLSGSEGIVHDMCFHILNAGGKRIRPLLIFFMGNLFSNHKRNDLIRAGTAAELIHMASLVHDDIIDNSSLRRNKPSVNNVWGNHYAALCGDYLFAKAFELLSDNSIVNCMKCMVEAIQNMCHGEIIQASERYMLNMNTDTYYNIIAKKTAIFLACCCKSGAIIGGADDLQINLAYQYGINLGYAFQIIDDILDLCGDSKIMGKPIGEDLRQGNVTLPVVLLMNHNEYGVWIKKLINERNFTEENMREIRSLLERTGIIKKTYDIAKEHVEKAQEALDLLPGCQYNELLFRFSDKLFSRVN